MTDTDLSSFLDKVDELESLVKGMSSGDPDAQKQYMAKADQYIKKNVTEKKEKPKIDHTGVNRSVINQAAFDNYNSQPQPPNVGQNQDINDQEGFMRVMEVDAQERAERRKNNEKDANTLKDLGNKEFNAGNFEKAVQYYSEGLSKIKTITSLWTNRAQAYIKLAQYEKALEDCDWALRVFENCLKAYIHKGRAHLCLKQYDQALECYNKALVIEPQKTKAISAYIQEVEQAQTAELHEEQAKQFLESGQMEAKGMVMILEKVNSKDQLPIFYAGGLRILAQSMKDVNEKTLFRTHGGLKLTETHHLLSKCFSASPRSLSREELDMCSAAIEVFTVACEGNEENQKQLLEASGLSDQISRFLESKLKHGKSIKEGAIRLIHQFSQTQTGRKKLMGSFDLPRLMANIFDLMKTKGSVSLNAVGILNNLALDSKFKSELRDKIEENILPAFEGLMVEGASNNAVLPSCISTITNLCGDSHIRHKLIHRAASWQACIKTMERHARSCTQSHNKELIYATLGLLCNVTVQASDNLTKYGEQIAKLCLPLASCGCQELEERSFGLLGHVLPKHEGAVKTVVGSGMVTLCMERLEGDDEQILKHGCKCLAACTGSVEDARQQVFNHNKGKKTLVELLKHKDKTVVGNTALILSHLVSDNKFCAQLTKTNIIMHLLTIARDELHKDIRQNVAILKAKLAKGDQRHLERLRELHGIEILHDATKPN